jgi:hypothetical protein
VANGLERILKQVLGDPLPELGTLLTNLTEGVDLENTRTRITDDLHLTPESFTRLMAIKAKADDPDPANKPTEAEWGEVYSILTTIFGPAFVSPAGVPFGAFGGTSNFSNTRVGWTVGAITNNWSVRAEYRYTDWGRINNTLFSGDAFALAFPGVGFVGNRHIQQNQVQVGFDYKFDFFAPPPLVSKY